MNRYYIASHSIQNIITAKTEAAAKMLFNLANPGVTIETCLKMAA